MRNILFILVFLVSFGAIAQGGPKVDVIKFRGEVTTTVRNTFDVPTGETWLIWNVTTDKLEIGDDAEVWSAVGTNVFDDIVYTPTDVLPTATKGTTYFDDSESTLKQYNGSVWEPVGVTAGSGDFKADGSVTGTGVFQQNLSGSTYFGLLSGLNDDQTSNSNTGFGDEALKTVVTGSNNTAVGRAALELATGNNNTAVGSQALLFQTTGYGNTAVGSQALQLITDGVFNTAVGRYALDAATGSSNVGLGANALTNLTGDTNSDNIGIGQASGQYISGGVTDLTAATNSIFIGTEAFPLANSQTNQIVIGHQAVGNGSNTVTIGNSSVTDYYLSGNLDLDGNITIDGTVDDVDMDEVVIGTHPTRLHTQVNSITFETLAQYAINGAPSAGEGVILTDDVDTLYISVPISDFSTVQTASTSVAKWSWRSPYDMTLLDARGSVAVAGTTSTITIDVHYGGTTIMTTDKIEIEATDTTSLDATTQPTLTTTAISDDGLFEFFIDGVDSGGTGLGYEVKLYYKKP